MEKFKFIKEKNNSFVQIDDVMQNKIFEDFGSVTYTEKTRDVIKVQDGCNNFCSYCIIPYARGRICSREPKSVLDEINKISNEGIFAKFSAEVISPVITSSG